jgi:glycosyltransferase involved in cell wall biosynthesis
MKIGIDISQVIYQTGVSDYTIELVKNVQKHNSQDQFVLFGSSLRRSADLKKIFPKSVTFPLPPTILDSLWNRLHVLKIESFIGPVDVFHSSDWTQPPSTCPKVTTVHDLSPFLFPDEMSSGGMGDITSVHAARMHWVVRECNKIICVSQSTAADMQRLFPSTSGKIVVIPEAMPTRFAISPMASPYSDYIVTIGTPQPRKNISRLVSAYLKYKSEYHLPGKLVVVGGRGWGSLDIPRSDSVIFTGYVSDQQLVDILAGASVFALPSLYEGFGLPVLVSFYHHIPVVTSNISSLPEVAGNAAVLVDPYNEEDIARGISLAIKNKVSLVAKGQQQLQKFNWETTATETLKVYRSLC